MHARALIAAALLIATPLAALAASVDNPNVPTGAGDAIFALISEGVLIPIAVRTNGKFMEPGSNDGGEPERLRSAANAVLATHHNTVNIIFGGRTIATGTAKIENGSAELPPPPSLHLSGYVAALASPTLTGNAKTPRRAATKTERTKALAIAASTLHTTPATLTVRNLTVLDLGNGPSLVATINQKGTATPRTDKRLFIVLEPLHTTYTATLTNIQTITVTEPLLEEPAEYLIDTLMLDAKTPALVTHVIGYDASTYQIYTRTPSGKWKSTYTGGGAAM